MLATRMMCSSGPVAARGFGTAETIQSSSLLDGLLLMSIAVLCPVPLVDEVDGPHAVGERYVVTGLVAGPFADTADGDRSAGQSPDLVIDPQGAVPPGF
ncbi:hypothetical protein HXS80_11885 [Streptomyces sp. CB04723]|uniref:hypothetical protein n=1 Tax=Streptomyces TaxID=1883 RepID=UPI0015C48A34|nr:hypothetical protein [Streptomyces sp. CB04723]QLG32322.1 hypothetical protein HXS80_11885 [Streptomyces sp. CB04723]